MARGVSLFRSSVLISVLGSTALLTVACGQKQIGSRWRQQAPSSHQETGVVVKLNDNSESINLRAEIEEVLDRNEHVEVREINRAQGLYEFYNIDSESLKSELKAFDIEAYRNVYFNNLVPMPTVESVNLENCKVTDLAPQVLIQPTSQHTQLMNKRLVDIKDGKVSFTAANSKALTPDRVLSYVWVLQGPKGSKYERAVAESVEISFIPDMPGSYTVQIVGQDSAMGCGMAIYKFTVTENAPYAGAKSPRAYDPSQDTEKFFHLGLIGAQEAWQSGKGEGVVIAILDTGVNYNHPDLSANVFVNSKERANGYDDDGNGYIDDMYGWDMYSNDQYPYDDHMHGTHVAGLAASAVTGVAPRAKILPVKVLGGSQGGGDLASIMAGIYYASDMGAHIINMSLGMDTFGMSSEDIQTVNTEFKKAIDYAGARGSIVVVAAGNGDRSGVGFDIDKYPVFPASVAASNLAAVAAVDTTGSLTGYSNFGKLAVSLAAPGGAKGQLLMSTYYAPDKKMYVGAAGTSMATPVTAGALAVLKSIKPRATVTELINTLGKTSGAKSQLGGKIKYPGVIHVPSAAQAVRSSSGINLWSWLGLD